MPRPGRIRIGQVVGVHGLEGWLKIHSDCDPREGLFDYRPVWIGERRIDAYEGRRHGRGLQLRPTGVADREDAEALLGEEITIDRTQLPAVGPGEYYHVDLVGLAVVNLAGASLGLVTRVLPGAANDVLLLDGGQLLPFTPGHTVRSVDLEARRLVVDWEADWS